MTKYFKPKRMSTAIAIRKYWLKTVSNIVSIEYRIYKISFKLNLIFNIEIN
jgi:hypothetical protein